MMNYTAFVRDLCFYIYLYLSYHSADVFMDPMKPCANDVANEFAHSRVPSSHELGSCLGVLHRPYTP